MPLLYLVLDFVKRNWFPILLALVIISGFLYVHNLQETIEDQELLIAKYELQLNKCNTAILTQNSVIEGWSKKTLEQNEEMAKLEKVLDETQKRNAKNIRTILNGYKPATCKDAIKYLIDQGKLHEH